MDEERCINVELEENSTFGILSLNVIGFIFILLDKHPPTKLFEPVT